ncbi:GntR family transcriptional regulator [Streptomyces caeruleatus]|uniref:HTH gntR-type domain-containing protein n=1 Tax=Streptomyces caeruleatus TaxID=661399 RepID=A0A101U5V9_9ACTN|nr:GntR family transcriptional regulator [Streptomyces caeruleatus]KUO04575.1 hypothetical protein AQJ67_10190 [Streptomyces caeruleatus]
MTAAERIERAPAMYLQVARYLADDILRGRYQPGQFLPSEAEMEKRYGIGKHTARAAVAELRRMGLVESLQGKGTKVLARGILPAASVDRSIRRTTKGGWHVPEMTRTGSPVINRTVLDGPPAVLLDQQDGDAISVDRMIHDPQTGTRMAHRVLIPTATAAAVPALAEHPGAEIHELYRELSDTGLSLSFTDHVTARACTPGEYSALGLGDASPLLIAYRITADADQGRPLLCEELKAPASDACMLTYPLTPTQATVR